MKKRLFTSLLLAAITIISFSSCKKDKDEAAVTKESLVGSYKLVSIKISSGGEMEDVTDFYVPGCQADDLYKLNADGSFVYVDAGTVCETPGDYESQWTLVNKTLDIDIYALEIKEFNGSKLVGTQTESEQGITMVTEFTFQKQ